MNRQPTQEQKIAFELNKARLEAQRMTKLYNEFCDLINSDPDFNYSVREFRAWLRDFNLI